MTFNRARPGRQSNQASPLQPAPQAVQLPSLGSVGEQVPVPGGISGLRMAQAGYNDNFVDPTEDLTCLICHMVARSAHQMSCCGKVVCSSCIEKWKLQNTSSSCFHCRQISGNNFPDPRTQNQIKELRISCKNEAAGCTWSGKLGEKEEHYRSCEFRSVECSNGCLQEVIQRNLDNHRQNECPNRLRECQICKQSGKHHDMVDHPSVCPRVQISCPNSCGEEMLRFQLVAHRAACPKEILLCPYSNAGCTVSILRKGLVTHLGENISQHLTLAMRRIAELEEKLEEATVQTPPVTFKMPGYSSRLQMTPPKPWYSPPFYTTGNASGYKMCLGVVVETQGISVEVYLMQGQNDNKLIWPFEGDITVELLNQINDENHHSRTIQCSAKSCVIPGERRKIHNAYGEFISKNDFEFGGLVAKYLENDCSYFRVSQVKVCKPWLVPSLFPSH